MTSGTTAIATTDDTPVTLISAADQQGMHRVVIINEGATQGFFTLDGGKEWRRWPEGFKVVDWDAPLRPGLAIQFKRTPGGVNATVLWAWGD